MRKNILSYVLSMALLLALFTGMAFPVSAAASATLSVADVSARPGDTVVVDVSLNGVTAGIEIRLQYDPAVLTPEKVEKGPACNGWTEESSDDPTIGKFVAIPSSLVNETVNGVIARYTYKVNPGAAIGKSSLNVVMAIMIDDEISYNATVSNHGSVTVSETPVQSVTSVSVVPNKAEVKMGSTYQFGATVTALNGAPDTVNWTVNSSVSTINSAGLLTVAAGETLKTLTVTATSTFDSTKFGTATVTVTDGGVTPPPPPTFPFKDVIESNWFYEDVYYMWENELMNGTSDTEFSPNVVLSRAMVITVIYRAEGNPSVAGLKSSFSDVEDGKWYTDAIKWAADKDIVLGYGDDKFGPNDYVTREQLATMIYRYQQYTGKTPPDIIKDRTFNDVNKISDYAKTAVSALAAQDIIRGRTDGSFDPSGNTLRSEFSAMMHRYLAAVE